MRSSKFEFAINLAHDLRVRPSRDYGTRNGYFGSSQLEASKFDHLGPFLGFIADDLPQFSGCHRHWGATEVCKPRLDLGIGKSSVDLVIQFSDDFGRRVLGRTEAKPKACFKTGYELDQDFLFEDPLVVVASVKSPWARRSKIRLAELVNEPWTWAARGTFVDLLVLKAFRAEGLAPPRATVLCDGISKRAKLVATGRFLAILPASTLRFHDKAASIKMLPVELSTTHRQTGIITFKNRTLSPLAQRFIECAHEIAKPLVKRK